MLVAPALEGKGGDKANRFLWACLSETCLYAARRIPEIADSIVDVDRAMRWGFGWELGPFEIWDAIGVERMAKALEREGKQLPPLVARVLASPAKSFYESEKGRTSYFDLASGALQARRRAPGNHHPEIAEGAQRSRAGKFGREPDRPRRRRAVLRIPRQDERHRRRHRRDAARRASRGSKPNSRPW